MKPSIAWSAALPALAVGLASPAPADAAWQVASAEDRQAIIRALREIRQRHGGHRLSQRWARGRLFVVWQPARGDSLLIRIAPDTGRWTVVGRAPAGR